MYIGNLSDFFYRNKSWLINQPKITKENKFQYIKIGGKIFKLNIYTGEIYEIKKEKKKNLIVNMLYTERNNKIDDLDKKKSNTGINFFTKNKRENGAISVREKDKQKQSQLLKKNNKSTSINLHLSIISKHLNKNKTDKTSNLYLNKKYALIGNNKQSKKRNNTENNHFLSLDLNNRKSSKDRYYNYPLLRINKSNENDEDDDSDNIFIEDDRCDIKKEDNDIIARAKNQIFKEKMFKTLQKQYNFFNDNTKHILSIPRLKLDTTINIYVNKNKSDKTIIKKYYLNRNVNNKNRIIFDYKNSGKINKIL